jgi:trans-2-enoyl-CoA reductase
VVGTWRSHAVTTEDQLMKVASDIPIHYAASLSVNLSTAYRLINDFGDLKAGTYLEHCGIEKAKEKGEGGE